MLDSNRLRSDLMRFKLGIRSDTLDILMFGILGRLDVSMLDKSTLAAFVGNLILLVVSRNLLMPLLISSSASALTSTRADRTTIKAIISFCMMILIKVKLTRLLVS